MTIGDPVGSRVKFYGVRDLGNRFQLERALEIIERYESSYAPHSISDVLELYNAKLFVEHDLFPQAYTDEQPAEHHCFPRCRLRLLLVPRLLRLGTRRQAAFHFVSRHTHGRLRSLRGQVGNAIQNWDA